MSGSAAQGGGGAGPERAAALLRLAGRSRELVDDLEAARPELLSVPDLNRTLKQVLRNQVAILEALAGEVPTTSRAAPRPAVVAEAPRPAAPAPAIAVRPRPAVLPPLEDDAPEAVGSWSPKAEPAPPPPVVVPGLNGAHGLNGNGNGAAPAPAAPEAAGAEAAPAGASMAEAVLQESRHVPGGLARALVELFDNRDRDYEKGLDKLNRWVSGGAGTPFQWRGDRAYLNVQAGGPAAVKNYEEQLMSRMGFSRRLGRLVVPGLQGEIVVYERPSS